MTSVFNTDASLPCNHDLFGSLIVKIRIKVDGEGTYLTARQWCLAGNANALPFLRNKLPHVPTRNMEGQETVFVRPLTIDQPGMRDYECRETLSSIVQWIAEVRKPSHHGKVQSLRDGIQSIAAIAFVAGHIVRWKSPLFLVTDSPTPTYTSYGSEIGQVNANLLTGRSAVRTRPLPLHFPCLGLGNLVVSQPSCLLRVAWQLGTERVLQLNDLFIYIYGSETTVVEFWTVSVPLLKQAKSQNHTTKQDAP
ncbi:LOW QUALITY PROTEIN: hypothetical protein T265_13882 [Opisthorchis viverrini]|uniref:Uncharacterized protein n=1 Tax=Opisthorchis viverrini TaxID=6198 RepID=A0A074ZJA7_OPIVI|nr:LOW QUALITY PROTEIN: hypothetical protein T265_13882 [Opisthorchis viverrini]KER27071.1 LOW QUALITY PROTEIN: hypothetical protein T265_13882 [Opisthorchis viverrini]